MEGFCGPSVTPSEATNGGPFVFRGSSCANSVDRKRGLLRRFRLFWLDDSIAAPQIFSSASSIPLEFETCIDRQSYRPKFRNSW